MNWPIVTLAPSVLEITNYILLNWPHVWWFPNWYLGVPLRYVTGPIVPFCIIWLSKLTSLSLENSYILLWVFFYGLGITGTNLFLKTLDVGKKLRWIVILLYTISPFNIYILLTGNGLGMIGFGIVGYLWMIYNKYQKSKIKNQKLELKTQNLKTINFFWLILLGLLIGLVALINLGTVLPTIIGLMILAWILSQKEKFFTNLLEIGLVLGLGLSLSAIWYTPGYFFNLLINPSFAGWPLFQVIQFLGQFLLALLPLLIGFWVSKKLSLPNKFIYFICLWLFSFGFLTFWRFLSDVDFILDWTGYFLELGWGSVLLISYLIYRYINKQIAILLCILIFTIGDVFLIYKNVFENYQLRFDYKEKIVKLVSDTQKTDTARYFFSGSPVFWLGEKLMINQVRGVKDNVATHKTWAMGAYQIREGESKHLLYDWLKILGVSKILVHSADSFEYFKDFKNLERFNDLQQLNSNKDDTLYGLPNSLAYRANKKVLDIKKPEKGNDLASIGAYAELLQNLIDIQAKPDEIKINIKDIINDEVVVLLITYDNNWSITKGQGILRSDNFGNMILETEGKTGEFILSYQDNWWGSLVGIFFSLIFIGFIIKKDSLQNYFFRKMPGLDIVSEKDEQEEY